MCIGTCIAISIDIINLSPAIAFGKVSHNERRGVLQVTGWKCVSRTIRNRELWNPFPFFSQPSLREPIYLSFGSSFYSITRRTRQSLWEIDFVQTTEQMHLSLTLPLLCIPCIFHPLNLAARHLSCSSLCSHFVLILTINSPLRERTNRYPII